MRGFVAMNPAPPHAGHTPVPEHLGQAAAVIFPSTRGGELALLLDLPDRQSRDDLIIRDYAVDLGAIRQRGRSNQPKSTSSFVGESP